MAQFPIHILRKTYQPAAVGSTETVKLWDVKKGDRILWGSTMPLIPAAAATTSTIQLQLTGGTSAGLAAAIDTETMVAGTPQNMAGSDLATSGGLLVTADGTIEAVYTTGATPGATNPAIKFTLAIIRHEHIA